MRRFRILKLNRKIIQLCSVLTISIVAACNKKKKSINQKKFIRIGEVVA